jgi:hypothetical protein
MTLNKKIILRLAILALAINLFLPVVHASVYDGGGLDVGAGLASGLGGIVGATSITELIIALITFVLNLVLILAVAAIIVAGIYLITSGGEEGQKDKAKKIITYAVIGIIVILLARVIVSTVNHIFDLG